MDLEAFRHDDDVEKALQEYVPPLDDEKEHKQLVADDDDTATTCSTSSSETSSDSESSQRVTNLPATAVVPTLDEVLPFYDPVDTTPAVIRALHQLGSDISELNVRVVDYYQELRSISPELSPAVAPKGHVDGGSIATTTDRKEYLFCYREFTEEEAQSTVRLKVADDTVHVPTGIGYAKMPCQRGTGSLYARCYYTPEIPATIVSPDAIARSLGCNGYSTFSNLINGRATMQHSHSRFVVHRVPYCPY